MLKTRRLQYEITKGSVIIVFFFEVQSTDEVTLMAEFADSNKVVALRLPDGRTLDGATNLFIQSIFDIDTLALEQLTQTLRHQTFIFSVPVIVALIIVVASTQVF